MLIPISYQEIESLETVLKKRFHDIRHLLKAHDLPSEPLKEFGEYLTKLKSPDFDFDCLFRRQLADLFGSIDARLDALPDDDENDLFRTKLIGVLINLGELEEYLEENKS